MSFVILIWLTSIAMNGNMFSLADSNGRDFLVWTDIKVMTDDQRNLARQYITDQEDLVVVGEEEEEQAIRTKYNSRWGMIYIWQNLKEKEYGLLQKSNLLKIEKVERMVNQSAEWKDYCLAQNENITTCSNTSSISSGLHLWHEHLEMKNLEDYTQKQIYDGFNEVLHDNDVWPRYK